MKEIDLTSTDLVKRFWRKINILEREVCWNWTAGKQSKGYGSFGIGGGKTELAHRVAHQLVKGKIPDGLLVRHTCDNRLCCNPAHLELGTVADNNRDAVERGRNAKGEKNGRAKLTKEQVRDIRDRHSEHGKKASELADLYKMHPNSIRNIVKRRYWDLPQAS